MSKPNCYCAHCRQQRQSVPPSAPAVATAHVEPPTSLVDRIAGKSIATAPVYGGGHALAVNARPADGVDDPPSLVDAIQNRRK